MNTTVREIIERSDIVEVASALGLQIDPNGRRPRKAICPFHDDQTPSLNLYQKAGAADDFHCFACGAHGDIVSLVQRRNNVEFWDSILWLAPYAGVSIEKRTPSTIKVDRKAGVDLFSEIISENGKEDALVEFSKSRAFPPTFLKSVGAGVVNISEVQTSAARDRVLQERLRNAGIIRPEVREDIEQQPRQLIRSFFSGTRIVFPLKSERGVTEGFAARALGNDRIRYLYSYDFPRRTTLYGADRVLKRFRSAKASESELCLYIVEGLFDQLRLQLLGLDAVALLGSRAAAGQLDTLQNLIEVAERSEQDLKIRVFLDSDAAGRDGAYDLLISLFRFLDKGAVFGIEVIFSGDVSSKIDPDNLLRNCDTSQALDVIQNFVLSPLEFMLGVRIEQHEFPLDMKRISSLQLANSARRIAKSLPEVSWERVLAPIEVRADLKEFLELIRNYGEGRPAALQPNAELPDQPDDPRAILISALNLGRSSTKRREYPLDEEAWERLAVAASPFFYLHQERLKNGDGPMAPFLARHVPKGGGRYRLKSGPVAADALLQQYAMIELLRERPSAPLFSDKIPAVRYDRRADGKGIYLTGISGNKEALSFAYQVDMAIVNGEAPPSREGIFRPYFECWRSFIDYLDEKIRNFRHAELQVLRLDITGFYDNVRRDSVANALQGPLENALAQFLQAENGPLGFAPLLKPDSGQDTVERAHVFTDFLLRHAFHGWHADPKTGSLSEFQGLAQGPDLSAYLANITLLQLDEIMRAEVDLINQENDLSESWSLEESTSPGDRSAQKIEGASRCSAAYARYVDDIIIICPDADIAWRLRRKIETHLQLLGLSLNRKNPTPPAMTRSEAREWLTDSRIGFGFSGPLSDMPETSVMDPLADAGDIDRRTALGLLFDPELDDLRDTDLILKRIERALQASEIRFGDRANAYRRLWLLAAGKASEGVESLAKYFSEEALRLDVGAATSEQRTDFAIAAIEAIERALRAPIPESLDEDSRDIWIERKAQLATAVLGDVFQPLAYELLKDNAQEFLLRYDMRCQIAIIAHIALTVAQKGRAVDQVRPLAHLRKYLSADRSDIEPLPSEIQLSLYRHDSDLSLRITGLPVPSTSQARNAFIRLETSLVRLQKFAEGGEDLQPEPAAELSALGLERLASKIHGIWAPGQETLEDKVEKIEVDAAATLVNLTYLRFAEVTERRQRVVQMISGQSNAVALPSPPGLEASGIMLWCDSNQLLFAAALKNPQLPAGVEWIEKPVQGLEFLRLWKADLPEDVLPLFKRSENWRPDQIALIYEAAHKPFLRLLESESARTPVPTAFSFFARPIGLKTNEIDPSTIKLVCWTAPRQVVDSHAFVRNGDSLEARSVYANGSDHWRFGWAIRDLCSRAEGPAEDIESLEQHGDAKLDREVHRREAIVARVLPRLSGADRWGPGPISDESKIPSRIKRALRLLRAFGQTDDIDRHASYLTAAIAEGVFMSERLATPRDERHSGRPAAIAGRAAKRVSRALPQASALWPNVTASALSGRRSASAWLAIASRIERQARDGLERDATISLLALATGTKILGVVSELRALAFELASALPAESLERLQRLNIDLTYLSSGLEAEIALVEGSNRAASGDPTEQAQQMLRIFSRIVEGRQSSAATARDSITPLGWLILVATLLQVTPPALTDTNEDRPALWTMDPESLERAKASILSLLPFLSATTSEDSDHADWPWECFEPLQAATPAELSSELAQLSSAARIRVETLHSEINPRTGENYKGRPVLRLSDGSSHRLSEWQIDVAFVAGERRLSTECEHHDGRLKYRYSVAWDRDRLVGIHLVSQGLADVAFASEADQIGSEKVAVSVQTSTRGATSASNGDSESGADNNVTEPSESSAVETELDTAPAKSSRSSNEDLQGLIIPQPDNVMPHIRKIQDEQWADRASRGDSLQRLAIVQWDVSDTYYSPGYRDGKHEGLRDLNGEVPSAETVSAGGDFLSVSEGRRRAILREVLRACRQFKVDGLVLPEYSLRAETVNWLSRQLRSENQPLTIWCGTFRVPDGTSIASSSTSSRAKSPYFHPIKKGLSGSQEWLPHTALITCLNAYEKDERFHVESTMRPKRYPSAAAGEMIRPELKEAWRPLLESSKNPFNLGTYTIDLICAEMFLHASSANYIGILEENRELASRYSIPWYQSDAAELLHDDMRVFARWTSSRNISEPKALSRGKALQRTIIVLPAMTSRSADYHIFGQNQYLASGLVTAFCNAVEPTASVGGSAFIGLDGWKAGPEIATPYGSIAPGIFQLSDKHSGPLGVKEAAMVIADIDPLRTTDQKPRPHYQARSLQLVAHLPLIFATEQNHSSTTKGSRNRIIRKRSMKNGHYDFVSAAKMIYEAMVAPASPWRDERAWENSDAAIQSRIKESLVITKSALDILSLFADDSGWLKQRTAAFCEKRWHYAPPKGLPALTDWLYIDDTWRCKSGDLKGAQSLDSDENILYVPRASSTSELDK